MCVHCQQEVCLFSFFEETEEVSTPSCSELNEDMVELPNEETLPVRTRAKFGRSFFTPLSQTHFL